MSMRVNKIVTHLSPENAYAIIELLDQLRDSLVQSYSDEIRTMLQEATQQQEPDGEFDDDLMF